MILFRLFQHLSDVVQVGLQASHQPQFQRIGYFNVDLDSTPDKLIFNRTASLKDSWAKEKGK